MNGWPAVTLWIAAGLAWPGARIEAQQGSTSLGDTGLSRVPSAYTLPAEAISWCVFRENRDRDPRDLDIAIHGVAGAWGVIDGVELFGSFGVQVRIDADAPGQVGFFNDLPRAGIRPWAVGRGDLHLGIKLQVLDDRRADVISLAFRSYAKLPTAEDTRGLGTGRISGGADLVLSGNFAQEGELHGAVGLRLHDDPTRFRLANALDWGLGLALPLRRGHRATLEVTGSVYSGGGSRQTHPVDVIAGLRLRGPKGWYLRPALSLNVAFDDRGLGSSFRTAAGLNLAVGRWRDGHPR